MLIYRYCCVVTLHTMVVLSGSITSSCGLFYLEPSGIPVEELEQPTPPKSEDSVAEEQDTARDNEPENETERTIPPPPSEEEFLNYKTHISPLISANCSPCHTAGNTYPPLNTYDELVAELDASLAAIENSTMPPSNPLEEQDKLVFKAWYDTGYRSGEEATDEPTTPAPPSDEKPSVSFGKEIQPILLNSCAINGCHDAQTALVGYDFESYNGSVDGIADAIAAIEDNSMPPSAFPRVAAKDLAAIKSWAAAGTPP